MILNFIYLQNYLQKFSSSKFSSQFFCFRLNRPTGPVDRIMCPGRACLCTSVGRPTGRPTCKPQLSVNFGRSTGRPPIQNYVFLLFAGRPTGRLTGRPEPNGYMPAGLTADRDGRPPSLPAANGYFVFGEILKICFRLFLWQTFSEYCGLFWDQISLIKICFNPFLSL